MRLDKEGNIKDYTATDLTVPCVAWKPRAKRWFKKKFSRKARKYIKEQTKKEIDRFE